RAHDGERLIITVDGVPTAQIGPISPSGSPTLDDLIAAGLVRAPRTQRSAPPKGGALMLDSSAFMRRYVNEPGRDLVVTEMAGASTWCAAAITRTEVAAGLHRMAWDEEQRDNLVVSFVRDWEATAVVPIDTRLLTRAAEIASMFALDTVDALHLAAADRLPRPVHFMTFSSSQIPAAAELGFEIVSS
ncbi:MAG: type II toxin-antitoxin system VapC family toxin, partial [Acidimicrobiales bacterium]